MSFRIDLASKEGVAIYLVVINNMINVNFETADPSKKELAQEIRGRFTHLLSAHASLEHEQEIVRGEDAEHVKRHHGIKEETKIMHMHYSFDQDVTPELLEHFFDQLLIAQKSPAHTRDQFVTQDQVNEILKNFGIFYSEFKGSKLEKEFLKERELTREEKDSLIQHAKQDTTGSLSRKDVGELEECGFSESEIPKPRKPEENIQNSMFLSVDLMDLMIGQLLQTIVQNRVSGFRQGFFQSQERHTQSNVMPLRNTTVFLGSRPGLWVSGTNPSKQEESEQDTMEFPFQ
ncbi:hypothetical protein [Legionella sp. WA2022007384]